MRYIRFILIGLVMLMIPLNGASAQSSIPQVIETTDQALSIRIPANWIGADITKEYGSPIYNHVIVAGENQSVVEAMLAFNLGQSNPNAINGKAGFFVSINREVFQEFIGVEGTAANVLAFVLDAVQQDGYAYEGPIEYPLGDTMAFAIAVYYGNVASFSMLFERGGLLIGGDIYTNSRNPVEDVPLFLEIFNSFVSPSENARPTTNTQTMGMLGGLTNQLPPTNTQQPPAPQPTPQPPPTNTPQAVAQQPTPSTTGNAGPMLSQLQNQQPPPAPQIEVEDGKKLVASLNGRFQVPVPEDWILLENTESDLPLEIILTNDEAAVMEVLDGKPLRRGVFIQAFVIDGDFVDAPVERIFDISLEEIAPSNIQLVKESRTAIDISDAPAYVAVFGSGEQIGLWGVINFGNSVMIIQLLTADSDTWSQVAETAIQIVFDIRYLP